MLDFGLAIAHHLIVFALFGILAAEVMTIRRGVTLERIAAVSRVDIWYGVLAGVVVIVGFVRAVYAAKGWTYYAHNGFFWAKIITFLVVALLSVPPTIRFIQWGRSRTVPSDRDVSIIQRFLYAEVALFALLPIFAAAMARGYGEL